VHTEALQLGLSITTWPSLQAMTTNISVPPAPLDDPPAGASLSTQNDTEELNTKIVSVWIQAPCHADILNLEIFDNVTRRVADRGTVISFTCFNQELFFLMVTEAQGHRVFQRVNNNWILDSTVFIRCRGPTT